MTFSKPPPRVKQWDGDKLPAPRVSAYVSGIPMRRDTFTLTLPIPKPQRHESTPWRRAVASLPCVLCGKEGETQCAHRNEGKGMSIKTDDASTAALCSTCHSSIDQGKDMTRDQRRATMDRAIVLTIVELARRGLVGVV